MNVLSLNWGENGIYGIEVSLFSYDPLDYEVHEWDWISVKVLVKILIPVYVFGLDMNRDRVSIGVMNCFATVFYN